MYAFNWALTAFRSESYIGSATALPDIHVNFLVYSIPLAIIITVRHALISHLKARPTILSCYSALRMRKSGVMFSVASVCLSVSQQVDLILKNAINALIRREYGC